MNDLDPTLLRELAALQLRDRAMLHTRLRAHGLLTIGSRARAEQSLRLWTAPALAQKLPDDLLLLVLSHVGCALALSGISLLCRRVQQLVRTQGFWPAAIGRVWAHRCWDLSAWRAARLEMGQWIHAGHKHGWVPLPHTPAPRLLETLRRCDQAGGQLRAPLLMLSREKGSVRPHPLSQGLPCSPAGVSWALRPFWAPSLLRRVAPLITRLWGSAYDDDDDNDVSSVPPEVAEAIGRARPHVISRSELRRFDATGGWPYGLVLERRADPFSDEIDTVVACTAEAVPAGVLLTELLAEVSMVESPG